MKLCSVDLFWCAGAAGATFFTPLWVLLLAVALSIGVMSGLHLLLQLDADVARDDAGWGDLSHGLLSSPERIALVRGLAQ